MRMGSASHSLVVLIAGGTASLILPAGSARAAQADLVELEKMTWVEVKSAMAPMLVGAPRAPSPATQISEIARGTSFRDCSNGCPEMVVVQQGRFTMGAPAGEEARENLPNQLRGRSIRKVAEISH